MNSFWTFVFYLAAAVFFLVGAFRAYKQKPFFPKVDFTALGLWAWVMVLLWSAAKVWMN